MPILISVLPKSSPTSCLEGLMGCIFVRWCQKQPSLSPAKRLAPRGRYGQTYVPVMCLADAIFRNGTPARLMLGGACWTGATG